MFNQDWSLVKSFADARHKQALHWAKTERFLRQTERNRPARRLLFQLGRLLMILGRRLEKYGQPPTTISPQQLLSDLTTISKA